VICESVRLPGQFLQFQPLIRDCQNQRESRPNRSEPAVRVFVPRQKREEPGRRKGVKESYHALVMLGGRGLAREKIQSSGDKRNRQDTQRNGAPEPLCEAVIVEVGAQERAHADDVGLPGKLRIADRAVGKGESDRENDPAEGDPGRT